MIISTRSGHWYWGFPCRSCPTMVAFEEATGDEPSRGPNVAIATNCPNGHFDVWLIADAVKFQAP